MQSREASRKRSTRAGCSPTARFRAFARSPSRSASVRRQSLRLTGRCASAGSSWGRVVAAPALRIANRRRHSIESIAERTGEERRPVIDHDTRFGADAVWPELRFQIVEEIAEPEPIFQFLTQTNNFMDVL